MREKNKKSIASYIKFPQFTTMNVIDGQAGLVFYSSLFFYSLTINNILNIIVLLILAGITISAITSSENVMEKARKAKEKTEVAAKEEEIRLKEINSKLEPEWDGTVALNYAGGTGTESDPFLIENGEQLAYLASQVNAGETYAGKCFSIVKSINLGNKEFTPIGLGDDAQGDWKSQNHFFDGILNGNNNVITGINIEQSTKFGVGLIGGLGINGKVQNINIFEGKIIGAEAVGAIAGLSNGQIYNCTNHASIIAQDFANIAYSGEDCGGIVGRVSEGTIQKCKNYGKIVTKYDSKVSGRGYAAGGIIGCIYLNSKDVVVSECENYGIVESGNSMAGGIAGNVEKTSNVLINYSNNYGEIFSHVGNAGGIVGLIQSVVVIDNCDNSGNVTAETNRVGGIAGHMSKGSITNCSNSGEITANTSQVGGIVGNVRGKDVIISDTYNSGIIRMKDSENIDYIGGIVGVLNSENSRIVNSYNKGTIVITENIGNNYYIGGVAGRKAAGSIENSYYYIEDDSNIPGIGICEESTDKTTKLTESQYNFNSLNDFINWCKSSEKYVTVNSQ